MFTKQRLERSSFEKMTLHSLMMVVRTLYKCVHQTKIGEVFFCKTNSALLEDGSDDVIQMQIPHIIPFIEAMSHGGAM
jgi:hypothetical protein